MGSKSVQSYQGIIAGVHSYNSEFTQIDLIPHKADERSKISFPFFSRITENYVGRSITFEQTRDDEGNLSQILAGGDFSHSASASKSKQDSMWAAGLILSVQIELKQDVVHEI